MSTAVTYINPETAGPPQGLYSHVARVDAGALYFIAGQLAVGADGAVVGKGDFDRQCGQVFDNLGAVLRGLDLGFDDIVKFTTYLVHSQDIERFMKLRAALFPTLFSGSRFPPNTLLVVDRLVKEDFLVEVEAVARARG
ncbi:MAG TPA: RidA family protein [Stellaceae bacterium]|nr:RidA family protein [Stellaceae bacterium]